MRKSGNTQISFAKEILSSCLTFVVAALKAFRAQRHAGRQTTRSASVGHKISCPNKAACRCIVVRFHCNTENGNRTKEPSRLWQRLEFTTEITKFAQLL